MTQPIISRPTNISPYAVLCLETLAKNGHGGAVSVGGALGLLHYLDYRSTHDADAWWTDMATPAIRQQVIGLLETRLAEFGQVRTRRWGDVVSVELQQDGRTVFSFQIAQRSAQLQPPVIAPWTAVCLDSFADLVASKMVALVERGAPRDFRDIFAICQAGLAMPQECWAFWRQRQRLSGSDADSKRAVIAIETHLARIAQHRPLERIQDMTQRTEAEQVRNWFAQGFLHAVE